jgi:hypothetical protein
LSGDKVFQVSDYYELLALHRTVMEAKFHPDPQNMDIPGSPLVARLSERIVETLIEMERDRGNGMKADQWTEWRSHPQAGRFWEVAVQHAKACRDWADWGQSEKLQFAADALAPFAVEPAELVTFVAEVDQE